MIYQVGRFTRDQFTSDAAFHAAIRCQMISCPELYPELAEAAAETERLAPKIRKTGKKTS